MLAALLGACACRGPDQLEHIALALTPSGELRLLVRRMSGEGEGGDSWAKNLRFAEQRDGSWRSEFLTGGEGDPARYEEAPLFVLAPNEERTVSVANVAAGTIVRARNSAGSPWEEVPADPGLPSDAIAALRDGAALSGAWMGSDGELRMLVGEWLLETSGGTIATAIATGDACVPARGHFGDMRDAAGYYRDVCSFVPTGDRAGTAVVFDLISGTPDHPLPIYRTTFQRLSCALDVCNWIVDPADGLGELPFDTTIFLQASDGTPILIRKSASDVVARTTTATLPIDTDIFRFGAATRPAGGFVVVTSAYYTDALAITAVNAAFEPRRFELPRIVLGGSFYLAVVVAPATSTSPERAHLLLSRSASSIAHLSVDLETGAVEREDFGI